MSQLFICILTTAIASLAEANIHSRVAVPSQSGEMLEAVRGWLTPPGAVSAHQPLHRHHRRHIQADVSNGTQEWR
jgi:hypothetical protein